MALSFFTTLSGKNRRDGHGQILVSCFILPDKEMNPLAPSRKVGYPVCLLYNINTCMRTGRQELAHDERFVAYGDSALSNTSYNLKRVRDQKIFRHDILTSGNTKVIPKACSKMLNPGAKLHKI